MNNTSHPITITPLPPTLTHYRTLQILSFMYRQGYYRPIANSESGVNAEQTGNDSFKAGATPSVCGMTALDRARRDTRGRRKVGLHVNAGVLLTRGLGNL